MAVSEIKGRWVVVLGASSGFGEAISLRLAEEGVNIVGVHLDRKSTLPHAEEVVGKIKEKGAKALFFNANAADPDKINEILGEIEGPTERRIHGLVHSLAFGALKPFLDENPRNRISKDQMDMTLNVMANSLVYWTQAMFEKKMLAKGARILAMTSSGGTRVWPSYGAVSAAKAALESHCRQLALELAPHGVAVNAVRAGVTDTPALRKIPGNDQMIDIAKERNPHRRLTTPEDVGHLVTLLMREESQWLTGNTLGVDGGEDIVG